MSSQPEAAVYRNTALTFGVEIEFCIASLNVGLEDPHPRSSPLFRALDVYINHPAVPAFYPASEPRSFAEWCVQLRIAQALSEAGFPSITENEITFAGRYPENERLARWIVTTDSSLRIPDVEFKYTWYKIEINSPAFYYHEEAVEQVKDVCTLLASKFRIHINDSMGVHVHVGDGKQGFQADVLRLLMATLFVFEPQLNTLHPRHRTRNTYCRSLTEYSKLGRCSTKRSRMLEELLKLEDKNDIVVAMSQLGADIDTYKLAYSLSNIMEGKKTIEFRQHESTLDPERVCYWISTCVGLVELPFRESRESIEKLLRLHVDDSIEKFDVVKVLLALNLTAQADFYDARFHALWMTNEKSNLFEESESSGSDGWISEIDDSDDERFSVSV